MSQRFLATGLLYCSCIGKEVGIECKVTLQWGCQDWHKFKAWYSDMITNTAFNIQIDVILHKTFTWGWTNARFCFFPPTAKRRCKSKSVLYLNLCQRKHHWNPIIPLVLVIHAQFKDSEINTIVKIMKTIVCGRPGIHIILSIKITTKWPNNYKGKSVLFSKLLHGNKMLRHCSPVGTTSS